MLSLWNSTPRLTTSLLVASGCFAQALLPSTASAVETEWKTASSSNVQQVAAQERYPSSSPAEKKPLPQEPALLPFPTTNAPAPVSQPVSQTIQQTAARQSAPAKPNDEFLTRLMALELAVSTVVAEQPGLWRFEPLEAEATELLLLSSSETDRQTVRDLAKRIEHFSDIARRYREARAVAAAPAPRKSRTPLARQELTSTLDSTTANTNTKTSKYDATGILRPVVSKRPNAPKFALVDDQGRITTFVTPTAAIDLEPLLGKRLGVRGSRGFIPEYQREHVTADRVATLDQLVR